MRKRCQVCLKPFSPKNYWQKYCTPTCKQIAWAMREKKKMGIKKEKKC